jgi:hypothetical protein
MRTTGQKTALAVDAVNTVETNYASHAFQKAVKHGLVATASWLLENVLPSSYLEACLIDDVERMFLQLCIRGDLGPAQWLATMRPDLLPNMAARRLRGGVPLRP